MPRPFFILWMMGSLLIRNLFFTILQPGIVAGLIPFLIVRNQLSEILVWPFEFYQWIGMGFMLIGVIVLLLCVYHFAAHGKGTLSPADPTKKLVIVGFYRYSRNPMYIAVLLILLGETIFTRSFNLGVYMVLVALAFYLFIVFFEEPRLQAEFGMEYEDYKKKVRRWL